MKVLKNIGAFSNKKDIILLSDDIWFLFQILHGIVIIEKMLIWNS